MKDAATAPEDQIEPPTVHLHSDAPPEEAGKPEITDNVDSDVIKDQKQTIALLVSEKAVLAQDLDRLSGIESSKERSQYIVYELLTYSSRTYYQPSRIN